MLRDIRSEVLEYEGKLNGDGQRLVAVPPSLISAFKQIAATQNGLTFYQKTSAGSAVRTLRIAIMADSPHITIVRTNTKTARSTVIENCI